MDKSSLKTDFVNFVKHSRFLGTQFIPKRREEMKAECIKRAFRSEDNDILNHTFYNTSFSMQTQFIFMSLKSDANTNSDNYDVGREKADSVGVLNKPIKCVDTWKSA